MMLLSTVASYADIFDYNNIGKFPKFLPPIISSQPPSTVTTNAPNPVTFTTSIPSNITLPATIQWYQNGVAVGTPTTCSVSPCSGSYTIATTTSGMNGFTYYAIASNIYGSITTITSTLNVTGVAVAFQGTSYCNANTSPGTCSITAPGGLQAGDVMLFYVATQSITPAIAPITGWTAELAPGSGTPLCAVNTTQQSCLFYRVFQNGDTSWSWPNLAYPKGVIRAYRSVHNVLPIDFLSLASCIRTQSQNCPIASNGGPYTSQSNNQVYVSFSDNQTIGGSTAPTIPNGFMNPSVDSSLAVPTITISSAQTVVAPDTAAFQARVFGSPAPTCQWFTGTPGSGTPISGAVNCASYNIGATNIGQNNTQYYLTATNSQGTTTSSGVILTVLSSISATALNICSTLPNVLLGSTITLTGNSGSTWTNIAAFDHATGVKISPDVTPSNSSFTLNVNTSEFNSGGTGAGSIDVTASAGGTNTTVNIPITITTLQRNFISADISISTINTAYPTPSATSQIPPATWDSLAVSLIGNSTTDPSELIVSAPYTGQTATGNISAIGINGVSVTSINAISPPTTGSLVMSSVVPTGGNNSSWSGTVNSALMSNGTSIASFQGSGSFGSTIKNVSLNVNNPAPVFTTQPSNQTVTAPNPGTFTIAVSSSSGTPTCQWFSGNIGSGTIINGANSCTGYTTGATSVGTFPYYVVATNTAGSTTSNQVTLTVNAVVAPAFTTQPSNQTVTAPNPATFTIVVSGPSVTCQWFTGTPGSGTIISGATSCTSFTTGATTVAQSGTSYYATATNTGGTATSTAAILTVNSASTVAFEGVSYCSSAAASGATCTISIPSGLQVGDVMLFYLVNGTASTIAPISGWNLINKSNGTQLCAANTAQESCVFYRVFQSGDTSWNWTGLAHPEGVLRAYRNAHNVLPADPNSGTTCNQTSSQNCSLPSAGNNQSASETYVIFTDFNTTSATLTAPSGFVNISHDNAQRNMLSADLGQGTLGSAYPVANTTTTAAAGIWDGIGVALIPNSTANPNLLIAYSPIKNATVSGNVTVLGVSGSWATVVGTLGSTTVMPAVSPTGGTNSSWTGTLNSTLETNGIQTTVITGSTPPPVAPTISTIANVSVATGATATFNATVTGSPVPSCQWMKNGAIITTNGTTCSSYTTPATVIGDNGSTFSLKATNSAGTATSNNATLTVTTCPVLTTTSGGSFTDGSGNVWTLASNGDAMINGAVANGGQGTSSLTLRAGVTWGQDAGTGNWFSWNGSGFAGPFALPACS